MPAEPYELGWHIFCSSAQMLIILYSCRMCHICASNIRLKIIVATSLLFKSAYFLVRQEEVRIWRAESWSMNVQGSPISKQHTDGLGRYLVRRATSSSSIQHQRRFGQIGGGGVVWVDTRREAPREVEEQQYQKGSGEETESKVNANNSQRDTRGEKKIQVSRTQLNSTI